ncbi:MAG: glycoside hydrolase family 88 protein [Firmicutes bacterium]|nr:glycoside hydrolase family 88 protein [Bacillota bacterium]
MDIQIFTKIKQMLNDAVFENDYDLDDILEWDEDFEESTSYLNDSNNLAENINFKINKSGNSTRLNAAISALLSMARYSWEQGLAAQAILTLEEVYNLQSCRTAYIGMCYDAVNRQSQDGRLGNIGQQNGVTDPVVIVPVLMKAHELTKDETFKIAIDKAKDWALNKAPRNQNGIVYHMDNSKQFWVDSLYMFPPTLLALGYADEAVKQADGYINALWDSERKLFRHIWDDEQQKFAVAEYWGVGNGWAIAGLSKLINGLPLQYDQVRRKYIQIVTETINAALQLEEKGMFHNFLDKSETFLEFNFSQMLVYTIKIGIENGWLLETLQNKADEIRQIIRENVDEYGFVKPVCGAPFFDRPGIAPEAQAFYILMETAGVKPVFSE